MRTIEEELDYTAQVMSKQAFWGVLGRGAWGLGKLGIGALMTLAGTKWGWDSLQESRANANAGKRDRAMVKKRFPTQKNQTPTAAQTTPGVQYMPTTPQTEEERLRQWRHQNY